MKTREELNALKNEVEVLNKKLAELNEEELKQVAGGGPWLPPAPGLRTDMKCQSDGCFYVDCWDGEFLDQIFDCPSCHNHTLKGIREWN